MGRLWDEQWGGMSILEVFRVEPQQSCVSHTLGRTQDWGHQGLLPPTTIVWSELLKHQVAGPHFAWSLGPPHQIKVHKLVHFCCPRCVQARGKRGLLGPSCGLRHL